GNRSSRTSRSLRFLPFQICSRRATAGALPAGNEAYTAGLVRDGAELGLLRGGSERHYLHQPLSGARQDGTSAVGTGRRHRSVDDDVAVDRRDDASSEAGGSARKDTARHTCPDDQLVGGGRSNIAAGGGGRRAGRRSRRVDRVCRIEATVLGDTNVGPGHGAR